MLPVEILGIQCAPKGSVKIQSSTKQGDLKGKYLVRYVEYKKIALKLQ